MSGRLPYQKAMDEYLALCKKQEGESFNLDQMHERCRSHAAASFDFINRALGYVQSGGELKSREESILQSAFERYMSRAVDLHSDYTNYYACNAEALRVRYAPFGVALKAKWIESFRELRAEREARTAKQLADHEANAALRVEITELSGQATELLEAAVTFEGDLKSTNKPKFDVLKKCQSQLAAYAQRDDIQLDEDLLDRATCTAFKLAGLLEELREYSLNDKFTSLCASYHELKKLIDIREIPDSALRTHRANLTRCIEAITEKYRDCTSTRADHLALLEANEAEVINAERLLSEIQTSVQPAPVVPQPSRIPVRRAATPPAPPTVTRAEEATLGALFLEQDRLVQEASDQVGGYSRMLMGISGVDWYHFLERVALDESTFMHCLDDMILPSGEHPYRRFMELVKDLAPLAKDIETMQSALFVADCIEEDRQGATVKELQTNNQSLEKCQGDLLVEFSDFERIKTTLTQMTTLIPQVLSTELARSEAMLAEKASADGLSDTYGAIAVEADDLAQTVAGGVELPALLRSDAYSDAAKRLYVLRLQISVAARPTELTHSEMMQTFINLYEANTAFTTAFGERMNPVAAAVVESPQAPIELGLIGRSIEPGGVVSSGGAPVSNGAGVGNPNPEESQEAKIHAAHDSFGGESAMPYQEYKQLWLMQNPQSTVGPSYAEAQLKAAADIGMDVAAYVAMMGPEDPLTAAPLPGGRAFSLWGGGPRYGTDPQTLLGQRLTAPITSAPAADHGGFSLPVGSGENLPCQSNALSAVDLAALFDEPVSGLDSPRPPSTTSMACFELGGAADSNSGGTDRGASPGSD